LLNVASTERSSGVQLTKSKGLRALLQELSDDEDEMEDTGTAVPDDPRRPWLRDYCAYLDVLEQVPEGWTVIQWWGVSWISVAIISIRTNITCNSTIPGGIISAAKVRFSPVLCPLWQNHEPDQRFSSG
jgi:hypothetical protein